MTTQAVREALAEQMTSPVRWVDCVRYLRAAGVSDFVELGAGNVLTPLIDRITGAEQPEADERPAMIERIRREVLQPEVGDVALEFDEHESFRRLGLDSIVYVRLSRKVQAVFGVACRPDVLYRNRNCAALADFLLAQPGTKKAEPPAPAPFHEYRDERVLTLLHDCANGITGVEHTIEKIRAGQAPSMP
ncbi:acyl carrier protein [Actinophytocola sediminis]